MNKNDNNKIKKYENIYFSNSDNLYKNQLKNIEMFQYSQVKNIFQYINFSFKYLNNKGSIYFRISIPNINLLNTIYFLTLIFEKVYIINKFSIFCYSFKNKLNYLKLIKDIKEHNYKFCFKENKNEKKLIKYLKTLFKIDYYYKKK